MTSKPNPASDSPSPSTAEGGALEKYRIHLGARYATVRRALDEFMRIGGRTIVELGTSRSFVAGGRDGCMENDPRWWQPDAPQAWDWGAGLFTRVCAEHLHAMRPGIHTVDISTDALAICRVITADYADVVRYHHARAKDFLRSFGEPVDLLYMDEGESGPDTETLHLRDTQVAIAYGRFSPRALMLVDDVNIPGSDESKGRRSIPYLLRNGFEIVMEDYQVLLQRRG